MGNAIPKTLLNLLYRFVSVEVFSPPTTTTPRVGDDITNAPTTTVPTPTTRSTSSCISLAQAADGLWATSQSALLSVQGVPGRADVISRVKSIIASSEPTQIPDIFYQEKFNTTASSDDGLFLVSACIVLAR